MSVQSLNGDSYQGGQVGANIQSQVGTSWKNPSGRFHEDDVNMYFVECARLNSTKQDSERPTDR